MFGFTWSVTSQFGWQQSNLGTRTCESHDSTRSPTMPAPATPQCTQWERASSTSLGSSRSTAPWVKYLPRGGRKEMKLKWPQMRWTLRCSRTQSFCELHVPVCSPKPGFSHRQGARSPFSAHFEIVNLAEILN